MAHSFLLQALLPLPLCEEDLHHASGGIFVYTMLLLLSGPPALQRLLEVSGMRGQGPAAFVLQNTLHHFLELARPRSGEPSLMAKEALFRYGPLQGRDLESAHCTTLSRFHCQRT